jgi:hypothetical protein
MNTLITFTPIDMPVGMPVFYKGEIIGKVTESLEDEDLYKVTIQIENAECFLDFAKSISTSISYKVKGK